MVKKIFKGAGVHADFLWLNGSGMEEYAAYKVLPKVLVPGDATPIDARWEVRAPGDNLHPATQNPLPGRPLARRQPATGQGN